MFLPCIYNPETLNTESYRILYCVHQHASIFARRYPSVNEFIWLHNKARQLHSLLKCLWAVRNLLAILDDLKSSGEWRRKMHSWFVRSSCSSSFKTSSALAICVLRDEVPIGCWIILWRDGHAYSSSQRLAAM